MKKNKTRASVKRKFLCVIIALAVSFSLFSILGHRTTKLINVPLEKQNDGEKLGNGCEVTALSMLLQYHGYDVNKNQLADLLDYVPVKVSDTLHGNPHDGFVGDIQGGLNAMGVAVEPIEKVANKIINGRQKIEAGNGVPFSVIEEQISRSNPVWIITTVDFKIPAPSDWLTWQTTSGTIQVCRLCHSVVITGMTKDTVFVNDPYGYKNREVPKKRFREVYKQMGSQALYLGDKG
jgi:uncharacterized protein YvpB